MKLDAAAAARDQFERFFDQQSGNGESADRESSILKEVYEGLDLERYEQIRASLLADGTVGSEIKYLDLLYWLRSKLRIALGLNLHRPPTRRVLDLGSGPGHFPLLCSHLGHQVTALDLGHIELYNRLIAFFGVSRVDFEIRPHQPLPRFPERFDLVTGFMVGFNKRSKSELWGEPEWLFFLRDLANDVIAEQGQLVLKLIRNESKQGWHFFDPAFADFVRRHGGRLDVGNGQVSFHQMGAFRDRAAAPAGREIGGLQE